MKKMTVFLIVGIFLTAMRENGAQHVEGDSNKLAKDMENIIMA